MDKSKEYEKNIEFKNRNLLLFITFAAIIFASCAIYLLISWPDSVENWPDIIGKMIGNPVTIAILALILGFLTVDRFKDLSARVTNIDKRLFDLKGEFQNQVEEASAKTEKGLKDHWDRIENRLHQLRRDYPWLESIHENDFFINVPTAIAALRNVEIFLERGEIHLAYEVLYDAAKLSNEMDKSEVIIDGTPGDFEALALIAYSLYEDIKLSDKLLIKASESAGNRV
jgi:hypothetical protein